MKRVVLDASAVIAFFEDRPGGEKVEELINQAIQGKRELLMSVVNWGEVYYSTWRMKGAEAARKAIAELAQLPIQVVDADTELTKVAAEFRAQYKLPYADCFAAALAKLRNGTLVTSDRDFAVISGQLHLLTV